MMFTVKLKILNQTPGGKWEFRWEQGFQRSDYDVLDLQVDKSSEVEVVDMILAQSEGTLKILSVTKTTQEDEDLIDYYIESGTPVSNYAILQSLESRGIIAVMN